MSVQDPTTYVIEMEFATDGPVPASVLEELDSDGDPKDWYTAPLPNRPGVRVSLYEPGDENLLWMLPHRITDVAEWLDKHQVRPTGLLGARMLTEEDLEAEAMTPSIPELLAASDVAEALGVSRQRVHQLHAEHSRFPEPVVRTGAGPLWTRSAIDWFTSVWERRPGRPRLVKP